MSPEQKRTALSLCVVLGSAIIGLVILELYALYCGEDGVMFSLIVAAIVALGSGFGGFGVARFWDKFGK